MWPEPKQPRDDGEPARDPMTGAVNTTPSAASAFVPPVQGVTLPPQTAANNSVQPQPATDDGNGKRKKPSESPEPRKQPPRAVKKKAAESASSPPPRAFALPTFEGLVRPPRESNPTYKHVNMGPAVTEAMLEASSEPGRKSVEALQVAFARERAEATGEKVSLAAEDVNRDHVLANSSIATIVARCVDTLRKEGFTGIPDAGPGQARIAPVLRWIRAVIADGAAVQEAIDELAAVLGNANKDTRKLTNMLANAPHNLRFGKALPNQHIGHGMDLPSVGDRIAEFAKAILDATLDLKGLVPTPVLMDATSQTGDVKTRTYLHSSTDPDRPGRTPYRREGILGGGDEGLDFFRPVTQPRPRSASLPDVLATPATRKPEPDTDDT